MLKGAALHSLKKHPNMNKIVIISILLMWSCSASDTPPPTLSAEQMIEVLTDVHLAEGLMQGEMIDRKDSLAAVYYSRIWAKYDIEEVVFYESYQAYTQRPKELEAIYDSVTTRLSAVTSQVSAPAPPPRERPRPFE